MELNELDRQIVRELLARELETVNHYTGLVPRTQNPTLRHYLEKIIVEEKDHIAEAAAVLQLKTGGEPAPTIDIDKRAESSGRAHPVEYQPSGQKLAVPEGSTLLDAALKANIDIRHVCGGKGQCGTCRVEVINGGNNLTPVTEAEVRLLGDALRNGWRLTCQTRPQGAVAVRVPMSETSKK